MNLLKGMVIIGFSLLTFASPNVAFAQCKPAPPNVPLPQLGDAPVTTTCVDCDIPFDTTTHEQLLGGLASNPYVFELRRALYLQDTVHQFESKAHFDNCDFDSSITNIGALLEETERYVERASAANRSGVKEDVQSTIGSAFFSLGQAMHAVQDFYAHTNYVELKIPTAKKADDIEVVEPFGVDRVELSCQRGSRLKLGRRMNN
jgi:hypothetical protein